MSGRSIAGIVACLSAPDRVFHSVVADGAAGRVADELVMAHPLEPSGHHTGVSRAREGRAPRGVDLERAADERPNAPGAALPTVKCFLSMSGMKTVDARHLEAWAILAACCVACVVE